MANLRRCIGSTRFGIEAHEAPPADFPNQPSQKDGLGRMCRVHWNQYTTALRKATTTVQADAPATSPEPIRTKTPRAARKAKRPIAEDAEGGVA